MTPEFKIYQIGDSQIIERLTYPRFTGIIKNSVESDIDIENVPQIADGGDLEP